MVGLLRDLLAVDSTLEVVGESTNARTAIAEIASLVPDVAVIDIALEDSSGFDVLKALSASETRPVCIVLSNFATAPYRAEAERLGAKHFFDKNGEILELLKKLTALAERSDRRSGSMPQADARRDSR